MMKKIIAVLIVAVFALSTAALAATYTDRDHDLTFEYDDALFEIGMDDETDDELLVILDGKDPAWGETTYVKLYLADLRDGEKFPTVEDFAEMTEATGDVVTQGEWNGYKDVIMYSYTVDGFTESVFIVPVYDHDEPEVEDILTVSIGTSAVEDEAAAMARDDAISAVLDSLKLIDD